MKIERTTANKIISLANRLMDCCILAVLLNNDTDENKKILCAYSVDEIKQLMIEFPQSILIYNQNPQAIEYKDQIEYADGQQVIEIFQDTAGVSGLRAFHQIGKIQTPVTLELSD